mmetsp:Transcript_17354/g.42443  ORF Transcript_17354/g.42443 Transcript_17354/m.42443 type:complete len:126 (+) Transcript_17354:671-1048(+)
MMKEVAEALLHLHLKGIVHGDLKMPNVVRTGARLLLIDLDASAKVRNKDASEDVSTKDVLPPEMIHKLKTRTELNEYEKYVKKRGGEEQLQLLDGIHYVILRPIATLNSPEMCAFACSLGWEELP